MIYNQFVSFVSQTDNQLYALCPFHKEKKPSFTVNSFTHEWYCHGCCEGGTEKEFIVKYYDVNLKVAQFVLDLWDTKGIWAFPSQTLVDQMHEELLSRKSELAALNRFGITLETIKKYKIGWEDVRVVFPILSRTDQYINLRKYLPPHKREAGEKGNKITMPKGLGKGDPKFFPYDAFKENKIFIVEGEKDCLAARSQGINAVTGTGGSTLPVTEMLMFKGKEVIIAVDNDSTGDKIAREYYIHLSKIAKSVKRAILPEKDYVDYYLKTGKTSIEEFVESPAVVKTTSLLSSTRDAVEVSLVKSEAVEHLENWVELKEMTVVGVESRIYSVPVKLQCICSNPKCDKMCALAPTTMGHEGPVIDVPARQIIMFVDSSDTAQDTLAKAHFKCKSVKSTPVEYINCQKIIFQESASFIEGLEEASFEHRYGIYTYPDNRLVPSLKYNMTAKRVTDPRNQQAIYLVSNAEPVLNSVSSLDLAVIEHFREQAKECKSAEELIQLHYEEWKTTLGIEGRPDLFGAILLTYLSVTEIPWQNGTLKGWLDTICMGDTRTGKSQMAQRFVKTLQLGGYINGENARRTGVIGGVQQFGGSWVITWGAIPLNDRGLLIIDEASGLDVEDVKDLSSTRSSGAVTINKVVKGEARARTRLLWLSNPRSGTNLQDFYWRGYGAFQEFIPVAEDQARFDLLVSAAREDIETLEGLEGGTPPQVEKWKSLVSVAWALPSDSIHMTPEFRQEVRDEAKNITDLLGGGPLIVGVAVHEKLLRLACAFGILCGGVNASGILILNSRYLKFASEFLSWTLNKDSTGYGAYIAEYRRARDTKRENIKFVRGLITLHPAIRAVLTARTFKGPQLGEILGIDRTEAAKILSELITRGLVHVMSHATYRTDGLLIDIARQMGKETQ